MARIKWIIVSKWHNFVFGKQIADYIGAENHVRLLEV